LKNAKGVFMLPKSLIEFRCSFQSCEKVNFINNTDLKVLHISMREKALPTMDNLQNLSKLVNLHHLTVKEAGNSPSNISFMDFFVNAMGTNVNPSMQSICCGVIKDFKKLAVCFPRLVKLKCTVDASFQTELEKDNFMHEFKHLEDFEIDLSNCNNFNLSPFGKIPRLKRLQVSGIGTSLEKDGLTSLMSQNAGKELEIILVTSDFPKEYIEELKKEAIKNRVTFTPLIVS